MNPNQHPFVSQAFASVPVPTTGFDPQPSSSSSPPFIFPQFSPVGPRPEASLSHPQQQHLQHLNMQQAFYQSMIAQQQQQELPVMPDPSTSNNKKTQSKADRRAEHNAIERARRESLNSKFQQLAHALPNLQNDRRPSKSTIIERTLEYVRNTVLKEERYRHQIQQLRRDNERLRRHLKKESRRIRSSRGSFSSASEDSCSFNSSSSSLLLPAPTPSTTTATANLSVPSQMPAHQWDVFGFLDPTLNSSPMTIRSSSHSLYDEPSDDDNSTKADEILDPTAVPLSPDIMGDFAKHSVKADIQ